MNSEVKKMERQEWGKKLVKDGTARGSVAVMRLSWKRGDEWFGACWRDCKKMKTMDGKGGRKRSRENKAGRKSASVEKECRERMTVDDRNVINIFSLLWEHMKLTKNVKEIRNRKYSFMYKVRSCIKAENKTTTKKKGSKKWRRIIEL